MSEKSAPTPPLWPGNLTQLRKELRARGLRLTKRFGQNFMIDPNLVRSIARAAGVSRGDVVLEVGPGAGHLTAAILETGARVVAVEIDAGFSAMLRERLGRDDGFRLVEGSVLAASSGSHRGHREHRGRTTQQTTAAAESLPSVSSVSSVAGRSPDGARGDVLNPAVVEALGEEMSSSGRETFRVASNLPYNVGAGFLIALASSDSPSALQWTGGAVTLQREVAERLAAEPGTKDYGAMTVIWRLLAEGRLDRTVPPEVFWPRPKVESALFTIRPRRPEATEVTESTEAERHGKRRGTAESLPSVASVFSVAGRSPASIIEFAAFVKALFSSRRKVLRSAVARAVPSLPKPEVEAALAAAGIDPAARAEDVAPEELLALWHRLSSA